MAPKAAVSEGTGTRGCVQREQGNGGGHDWDAGRGWGRRWLSNQFLLSSRDIFNILSMMGKNNAVMASISVSARKQTVKTDAPCEHARRARAGCSDTGGGAAQGAASPSGFMLLCRAENDGVRESVRTVAESVTKHNQTRCARFAVRIFSIRSF